MPRKYTAILMAIFMASCVLTTRAQEEEKPTAKAITFTKKAPVAGDFFGSSQKNTSENSTEMTRDGESQEPRKMTTKSDVTKEVTILATNKEGAVTKAQVMYKKIAQERPSFGGQGRGRRGRGGEDAAPRAQMTDLEGQTFVLDFSGETPKVTNPAGEAAAENLAKLVLRQESKDNKFTGWGTNMIDVLGKNKVTVGESITLDKNRLGMLVRSRQGGRRMGGRRGGRGGNRRGGEGAAAEAAPETMKATLTLKGTKKVFGVECGEFELVMNDSSSSDNERMTRDSKQKSTGTVLIGINNGWLYSLSVDGTQSSSMSMSRGDTEMEIETSGTSKTTKTIVYSKKKLQ